MFDSFTRQRLLRCRDLYVTPKAIPSKHGIVLEFRKTYQTRYLSHSLRFSGFAPLGSLQAIVIRRLSGAMPRVSWQAGNHSGKSPLPCAVTHEAMRQPKIKRCTWNKPMDPEPF